MLQRAAAMLAAVAAAAAVALAAAPASRPDHSPEDRDRVAAVVRPTDDFARAEPFEAMQGGATTARRFDRDAFSQPAANLDFDGRSRFAVGNGIFRKLWVPAPASTAASDGLGPLFNARGCQECHIKDGRGRPPEAGGPAVSFILAFVPPAGIEPTYGRQLQDFSVPGIAAEGRPAVAYRERRVAVDGGEVLLREPVFSIEGPRPVALAPGTALSPRVAPPMIGLGLLEAVVAEDILAQADPDDRDGDGISGRAGLAADGRLGRFGWRAAKPDIAAQAAGAFFADMGLSSPALPDGHGDCTDAQPDCRAAPVGAGPGEPEVPQELLDLVVFYSRHLAVPARREVGNPDVLRGKALFYGAGCPACHTPKYVTSDAEGIEPALRRQLIWPYTDLLLHDMGEDLADRTPAGAAATREWRTPPLWGLGLTATVGGGQSFLHDGRARTPLEAVLWHGGEATAARDAVAAMPATDGAALLRFLESL